MQLGYLEKAESADTAGEPSTLSKRPRLDEFPHTNSAGNVITDKMRLYKDNLRYIPEWKKDVAMD